MMADYCWNLQRDCQHTLHSRKFRKEVLFLLNEHFESYCISFKIIVVPYIIFFTLSVLLIGAILCLLS